MHDTTVIAITTSLPLSQPQLSPPPPPSLPLRRPQVVFLWRHFHRRARREAEHTEHMKGVNKLRMCLRASRMDCYWCLRSKEASDTWTKAFSQTLPVEVVVVVGAVAVYLKGKNSVIHQLGPCSRPVVCRCKSRIPHRYPPWLRVELR